MKVPENSILSEKKNPPLANVIIPEYRSGTSVAL